MFLIAGLGNPEEKFKKTRHNTGFLILDFLNQGDNWQKSENAHCFYLKKYWAGKEVELIKPLVHMNDSGKSIGYVAKKYRLKSENIIIVHDDLNLILGKIRISKNKGAGGHKGVQSIINELKTKDFVRLRIGTKPINNEIASIDWKRFVLEKFKPEEQEILKKVKREAISALRMIIEQGHEKAMTRFN